jgi:hypothetical protein
MGTASQSFNSKVDKDEFDALVKDAIGNDRRKQLDFDLKCSEIVTQVLQSQAMAGTRGLFLSNVNDKVKSEVRDKLKAWIAAGKKPADWPLK